jgi:molecular chaperone HscB
MTRVPAVDPFVVLGVERRLDLDERELERRWLRLSRETHPDHLGAGGATDCAAVLARAAEINDAWRQLRDRWTRAQALLEILAPCALAQHDRLDPAFLESAMELAEEVALAPPATLPALQRRLAAAEDAAFARVQQAVAARDLPAAARALHESKYVRKARADLEARRKEVPA